ncbi:paraquat-inducible protein A [Primorskyibacter aestuariivivens]|uniref:paraquat-inducible protein A n=1 Tax=Primorskyibacter aestuariivivens TaxID=1888912 RepID=UPI0023007DD2|nr:paraquat-inducible protein A [Primorskyibacter aestuariivivens]MDA7427601.1 paraquat-inducible protein A [Primorskyibacter aestuariivivens]
MKTNMTWQERFGDRALIACPTCDTVHVEPDVPDNHQALCCRCGHVLAAPRENAQVRVLALAVTSSILMIAAVFFPFISLDAGGLHNKTSIMDAVLAFSTGLMAPLSLAVALMIVLIPAARLLAIIYTLWPMVRGDRPFPLARKAFGLAERLRPWSMAEIFVVGVAVALVKVAGLATLNLGPAFWAFVGLVVVTVFQDTSMCRYTIWKWLEKTTN